MTHENVSGTIFSMTTRTTEKIAGFRVVTCTTDNTSTRTVFLDWLPVVHFDVDNDYERRIAVIALVERGICNNKNAGIICDFHRNTVFKLIRAKKILGLEAACKDDRGSKGSYKYINETRTCIKKLINKYPNWSDQQIANSVAVELGIDISRSSVSRVRNSEDKKIITAEVLDKKDIIAMTAQAELIVREHTEQLQLWLDFETEPELKAKAEELATEPEIIAVDSLRGLVNELKIGRLTPFAGGFMHHLFLHEIGFKELISPFGINVGATYQASDILSTIFHSITQGIDSIEALKLVNASDFGLLIGRSRIPEKETMRTHLEQMAQKNLSGDLIERFAMRLLEQHRIDCEAFFIDGHFLPYYGMAVIAKGYFTVRRLAMRGNELYAITDLQGRPLFFITESNEIDFRPIIIRSATMLENLGVLRPILVFDRGGYGIHFFSELDKIADFVTWAKYLNEKSMADIPDDNFNVGVYAGENHFLIAEEIRVVSESASTAKNDGREKPTTVELRLVILKDTDTGKRLGVFTNNMIKPAYEIAWYMLQRWGKSENVYKELMAKFYINYHPGYDIKEIENQPMVDNPDIVLIKKAIKALEKEIVTIDKDILLNELLTERKESKKLERELIELKSKLQENTADIAAFESKLKSIPEKVSVIDLLKGKSMGRCDLEKKKLYDLMQFMAYHSRERLVEIFNECYDDGKDIKRVLDMLTTKPGVLKLVGNTLMVILSKIDNKKYRCAAEKLCKKLNELNIVLVGGLDLKLFFYIGNF